MFVNVLDGAQQVAEFDVLSHMTDGSSGAHKFAIPLGHALPPEYQAALERLMVRDWVRLIDIAYVPREMVGMFDVNLGVAK